MTLQEHPPPTPHGKTRVGWLVTVAFAVGAATGGLVTTVVDDASSDVPTTGQLTAAPLSSSESRPAGEGPEARLTDACLLALEAAEQTYTALDEASRAIADLNARRLDEVLHDLRPLREQLRAGTAACDVDLRRPAPSTGIDVAPSPPADR